MSAVYVLSASDYTYNSSISPKGIKFIPRAEKRNYRLEERKDAKKWIKPIMNRNEHNYGLC